MSKLLRSGLCIFLCALMLAAALPTQIFASGAQTYTGSASGLVRGDIFEMGLYPQKCETDDAIIGNLNSISCEMKQYDYYKNVDSDAGTKETINMYYADIALNGKAYRKVTISEYRPMYCSQNEGTTTHKYQSDNGYEKSTYYFLYEPIRWKVLANEDSGVYVMSEKLLDSPYYNMYAVALTWETSGLRSWLNNGFYELAFSSTEQGYINQTTITNEASPFDSSISGGKNTTDHIWILSRSETLTTAYGFSNLDGAYASRTAVGTDYAKCQGLYVDDSEAASGLSSWWLRNPGAHDYQASVVYTNGSLQGKYNAYTSIIGVRPVFRLNRSTQLSGADTSICRITGHDYVLQSSSVAATCTQAGHNDYKCSICSATKTEPIAALGHDFVYDNTVEATCTTGGYDLYECSRCHITEHRNETAALGHDFGEPSWTWADDYSSAAAAFTCSRCQHKEDVDASVTREVRNDKHYAIGSAEFGGKTYTDERITDLFTNYSLSLDGSIGVNFYLNLTEKQISDGAVVDFSWTVNDTEKTKTVTLTANDLTDNGYRATCPIAIAEMTYDITATLSVGGEVVETDTYSAKRYADVILNDEGGFKEKYISAENSAGRNGDERYDQLITLVKTMLDYGSKAQIRFDRNTDKLANGGKDFFTGEVNIPNGSSNMSEYLSECGLEYVGTSVVYLSETTLRHYYRITEPDLFTEAIQNAITFDSESVTCGTRNDMIYFDKKNIAASQLDTEYDIVINGKEYHYSALDYSSLSYSKDDKTYSESIAKQLAASVYRYNQAANDFFGD